MGKNAAGAVFVKMWKPRTPLVVFIFMMQFFALNAWAQSTVTGKVLDVNGSPLTGVTVASSAASNSTSTDDNGAYSLHLTGNNQTLTFTIVGYKDLQVLVRNRT